MGKGLDQLVPEKKAKKCSYTANVSVYSECNLSGNGVCKHYIKDAGEGYKDCHGEGG